MINNTIPTIHTFKNPNNEQPNQWLTVGFRSSEYGLCLDNLLYCDQTLIELGYK